MFRRSPPIGAIREQLAAGAMGRPLHFNGHYWCDYGVDPRGPMSWRYKGGPGSGALSDIGSHLIDLAEFVCGPIRSVRGAVLSTFVSERALPAGAAVGHAAAELSDVTERWRTRTGHLHGHLRIRRDAPCRLGPLRLANILGFEAVHSEGAATFDLARAAGVRLHRRRPAGTTQGFCQVLVGPGPPEPHRRPPDGLPGSATGKTNRSPSGPASLEQRRGVEGSRGCSFEEGLHNIRLLDAVVASAKAGGADVTVD